MKQFLCLSVAFLLLGSLSQVGLTAELGPSATISFSAKSATLTEDAKAQLNELMKKARSKGTIDDVQLAVWADNPAPRKGQLSKSDRELADSRAQAIRQYLEEPLNVKDVDTYNMAERPNLVAKAFNTTDAKVKKEMHHRGEGEPDDREAQIFKENGSPSKAVVLVRFKE